MYDGSIKIVFMLVFLVSASIIIVVISANLGAIVKTASVNAENRGTLFVSADLLLSSSSLDWGTLEPSENKTEVVTLQNIGNVPLTLYISTANWSSMEAQNALNLTWNYSGAAVKPQETLPIALTLIVSENPVDVVDFSFDIVITGTQ